MERTKAALLAVVVLATTALTGCTDLSERVPLGENASDSTIIRSVGA